MSEKAKVRVGFFDSGFGGRSVLNAFLKLQPEADTMYLADTEYCPYGEQGPEVVLERSRELTRRLAEAGCSIIVLACNSASAVALKTLRKEFPALHFVGMEPAIKPAAKLTKSGHVGVLGTKHTLAGQLFSDTTEKWAKGITIHVADGEGFVEIVERGECGSEATLRQVEKVLAPLLAEGCDTIVLACTHYPFLLPAFKKVAPNVIFIDPSDAVAARINTLYEA